MPEVKNSVTGFVSRWDRDGRQQLSFWEGRENLCFFFFPNWKHIFLTQLRKHTLKYISFSCFKFENPMGKGDHCIISGCFTIHQSAAGQVDLSSFRRWAGTILISGVSSLSVTFRRFQFGIFESFSWGRTTSFTHGRFFGSSYLDKKKSVLFCLPLQ